MTNSPLFDRQLALDDYWQNIGGLTFLPGTNRAADRFVRASFYVDALPQTADTRQAVAGIFSVIRNVSVPLGISVPTSPISPPPAGGRCPTRRTGCIISNPRFIPIFSGWI